ncbi:MAG TPA: hypothetical protein VHZ95_08470 [Polyangiales bacterium]|nr:hypothetical protein [Polyangiales bacterium]
MSTPFHVRLVIDPARERIEGCAVGCEGARLHFVSPRAFPPGQPLSLSLLRNEATPLPLAARCLGSKRRDDGSFDVSARLINLGRVTKAALADAFSVSPAN